MMPSQTETRSRVTGPACRCHWVGLHAQVLTTWFAAVAYGMQGNRGWRGAYGMQGNRGWRGAYGMQGNRGWRDAYGMQGNRGWRGAYGMQGNRGCRGASESPIHARLTHDTREPLQGADGAAARGVAKRYGAAASRAPPHPTRYPIPPCRGPPGRPGSPRRVRLLPSPIRAGLPHSSRTGRASAHWLRALVAAGERRGRGPSRSVQRTRV